MDGDRRNDDRMGIDERARCWAATRKALDGLAAEVVLRCWQYQLSQTRLRGFTLGTPGLSTSPRLARVRGIPWRTCTLDSSPVMNGCFWAIAAATTAWWSTSRKAPSGASSRIHL